MLTQKRGFTLVEILTVVSIIMIVGGFSLVAVGQARVRARDDQRIRDIKLIQSSLELYRIDIDRSTEAADAGKYAYPVRITRDQAGIYGDTRFAKYLTKTPTDPLRKMNYVYFAPACLRPATATQPAVVSPATDGLFHTYADIRSKPVGTYCPQGSGWLPYIIYGLLEQPVAGNARSSNVASLANSTIAVAHSLNKPIFATDADAVSPSYTTIATQSYCYPAQSTSCTDGFEVVVTGTPTPSTSMSPINSLTPSPIPSMSPMISPSPSPVPSPVMSPIPNNPSPSPSPTSFGFPSPSTTPSPTTTFNPPTFP